MAEQQAKRPLEIKISLATLEHLGMNSDNARRATGKQEYPKIVDQLLERF